jgi:trigger factor
MALIEKKNVEDGKLMMTAKIDAATFLKAVDKVYHRENKKISIQGFRKGKTPRAVIERMYGEDFFYDNAINDLLPDLFENTLNEADIQFIGRPAVDVPEVNKENGVTVTFTVKLRPELTVKKYNGIAGTKTVHTVEDAEIDAEIERLREQGSRMVTVEDRAALSGDTANIDFEGFVDDVAFDGGKGEKFDLVLGSGQFIPGFEDQVVGRRAGEEFDVNVTFPEEYGAKELAGKVAVFKVKLRELRFKELPEADDEFAKDVSEFDTLKELKDDIRAKKQLEKDAQSKSDLENALVDAVAETLEGEVPQEIVDDRIDEMVREFGYRLSSQGLDLKTYLQYTGFDESSFRETFKEQANKHVKQRLALEAVVRAEGIEASEEDVENEYKKLAEMYHIEMDKVKEMVPVKELIADVKVGKAIDIIRDNAKVKEEKAKKAADKPAKKKTAAPKKEDVSED